MAESSNVGSGTDPASSEDEGRLDRRGFIRATAAASGAIWIAPTVTGVGIVPAFAVGTPPPDEDEDDDNGNGVDNGNDDEPRDVVDEDDDNGNGISRRRAREEEPEAKVEPQVLDREPDDVLVGDVPDEDAPEAAAVQPVSQEEQIPRSGADTARLLGLGTAAVAGGAAVLRASRDGDEADTEAT